MATWAWKARTYACVVQPSSAQSSTSSVLRTTQCIHAFQKGCNPASQLSRCITTSRQSPLCRPTCCVCPTERSFVAPQQILLNPLAALLFLMSVLRPVHAGHDLRGRRALPPAVLAVVAVREVQEGAADAVPVPGSPSRWRGRSASGSIGSRRFLFLCIARGASTGDNLLRLGLSDYRRRRHDGFNLRFSRRSRSCSSCLRHHHLVVSWWLLCTRLSHNGCG